MFSKTPTGVAIVVALLVITISLALLALVVMVSNQDDDEAALTVTDAWVRATSAATGAEAGGEVPPDLVTGAFMVIHNADDDTERLVAAAVAADLAASVEIHETTMGANDVMQMRPVEGIDVPGEGSVELKPGSYHIMLLGLTRHLVPGDSVPLTLTFESGATLSVTAEVRALDTMPGMTG